MAATALYLRISQDDDNQDESFSIANQRDLLGAYAANDPVLSADEVLTFVDDGWSGMNFERPQIKALLDLVRRGGVKNILVKDLSRWGRNYPEVSEYLDQIFPFLGVRFISVNDQYDSEDYKGQTAPMSVAFSSIVHDIYSKELSVKVRQSFMAKAKKGEYVCGSVPYGFLRSETERNLLVIDSDAAIVIQRIFDMACEGLSSEKIAAALNADGVDSPLEHRRNNGRSTLALHPKAGRSFWDGSVIRKMLCDERYIGTMVFCKTKRVSGQAAVGGKRDVKIPEADWVRVPDAHKAIISTEQFERVRVVLQARKRSKGAQGTQGKKTGAALSKNARSPFAGKVVCGYCNRNMRVSTYTHSFFYCPSVKQMTGQGCFDGKVYHRDLVDVLLPAVKMEAQKALQLRDEAQKPLRNKAQKPQQASRREFCEKEAVLSELRKLTVNITQLEQRRLNLYEDFAESKIGRDSYVTAKAVNGADLEVTLNRIAELSQRLAGLESNSEPMTNVSGISGISGVSESVLRQLLTATEVTVEVISLLDRMVIYDNGRIEIRFAFGDTLSVGNS